MPRHIDTQPTSPTTHFGDLTLPLGAILVANAVHQREVTPSSDPRAIAQERWGDEPIDGTFSIVGDGFELTLVDSLHSAVRNRGFASVRRSFLELERRILEDPHGSESIDHFKDTDAGQYARVVHRVTGPLADLVPGKQVAIKGSGLNEELAPGSVARSKLTDQFRATLDASRRQQEKAPEGIGGVLSINEVYGVLRYRSPDTGRLQEWMLMEYIQGGTPIPNRELVTARLSKNQPAVTFGFSAADEPALAELLYQDPLSRQYYAKETERFSDLAEVVSDKLGYYSFLNPFADLNGNNILRQETPKGPHYTIIDVKSH